MAGGGGTRLVPAAVPSELWPLIEPLLREALQVAELSGEFQEVCLCLDDLGGGQNTWYQVLPLTGASGGYRLVVTCHAAAVCRQRPFAGGSGVPIAVWEQMEMRPPEPELGSEEFSALRCGCFLNHHLLTVADLRRGRVEVRDLPPELVEAFGAAWSVTVDGRLDRGQSPGYPLVERRRQFTELFGPAGILLPSHWQLFDELWSGERASQASVLGAVKRLPLL